jgi:predicted PurR-regulated permease PerM
MLISGFQHVVALGLLAGALEFIPMAGWMTAAATIITIGVDHALPLDLDGSTPWRVASAH